MQEKRSRDQIKAQILALCQEGTSKTRIVYQVNLNFKTVNEYLDLLLEKGLLEAIPGERVMYNLNSHWVGNQLTDNFSQKCRLMLNLALPSVTTVH